MTEKKITSAKADNIQIKQLYESAFPENERIPWPDLMRLIDEIADSHAPDSEIRRQDLCS